jgi:hypothetical protein
MTQAAQAWSDQEPLVDYNNRANPGVCRGQQ